jgi:hypothetical protein
MNLKRTIIYISLILACYSCKKDLGNYSYTPAEEPIVVNFKDETFPALVGDTLVLMPYVKFDGGDYRTDLSYEWEILVEEEARTVKYTGYPLKAVYNLAPKVRTAKLTITDNRNGIKYFFPFKISGNTQFSVGKTVLSVDNGITKLSFIKPDNKTVMADLYSSVNGEQLPTNPVQLFAKPLVYQPGTVEQYWVLSKNPDNNSVFIDASSMIKKQTLKSNFFNPPATLIPVYMEASKGYASGIMNNKLYISATQTAPFSPDFGKFTNPQPGNYSLAPFLSVTNSFYFGFDTQTKAFVSFASDGSYTGTEYTVTGTAFDPKNVGMTDLIFMNAAAGTSYAFFKDGAGQVYELSFFVDMNDYQNKRSIRVEYKRVFKGAANLRADSKWQRSPLDVYYFSSDDKIYRYNPVNESLTLLPVNFGGRKVTMMQLDKDGNILTAGVEGSIFTIEVGVGKDPSKAEVINGIPGTPVDIVIKK